MFDRLNFEEDDFHEPDVSDNSRLNLFRKPASKPINKEGCHTSLAETGNRDSPLKKFGSNSPNVIRRRFPGPAGLLPDLKPLQTIHDPSLTLDFAVERTSEQEPVFCSQTFSDIFEEAPYKKLQKDFGLSDEGSALFQITVELVKFKNMKRRKIPFLALVLDSIDCVDANGTVLKLRDRTGVIKGVLPVDLWKEMEHELKCGSALALKNVGIISYINCLNITKCNIVKIYTPENDGSVSIKMLQQPDCQYLARSAVEWHACYDAPSPLRSPHGNLQAISSSSNLFQLDSCPTEHTPKAKRANTSRTTSDHTPKQFRPTCTSPVNKSSKSNQRSASFDLLMNDDDDFSEVNLDFSTENIPSTPIECTDQHNISVISQEEASMVKEILADLEFEDFI